MEGKILVVDDHPDLAANIAEILGRAGHNTVTAASAEAGLTMVTAGGIRLLITDLRLPGQSGVQLIAELRRRGNWIPAVVMSAFTDDETISEVHAAGAVRFFSKPIDLDQLMSTVETMADSSRA